MKINQRDIIEVSYELPNGSLKGHPALVISNNNVLDAEDIFYTLMISSKPYNDDFTFEINNSMLTKLLTKNSFVKCQLIQAYKPEEVIKKLSTMKSETFELVKMKLLDTVF